MLHGFTVEKITTIGSGSRGKLYCRGVWSGAGKNFKSILKTISDNHK